MSVRAAYDAELTARGYHSDPAQLAALAELDRCAAQWAHFKGQRSNALKKLIHRPAPPKGVYLHGGVGRGKSLLMDCFFKAVPLVRKTRLHFHEFMREVHHELRRLQGQADPLDVLAKAIARRHRLICFDEFHVTDITDALILHRLLAALFENGVGLVASSNFHPDDLYPNGLHRERMLDAIKLLKEHLVVVQVDHGVDYRRMLLEQVNLYLLPAGPQADAQMALAFERLAAASDEAPVFTIGSRDLTARRRADGVIWFDFKALCGGPRSQNEYIEIASRFHSVLLSDVPAMPARMASEARRFAWLVDVLYDRRVKLMLSAQAQPEELYTEGPLAHEFPRVASRLREMRSSDYLALARREVDTALT
jgi:cell division protein ZapE